MPEQDELVVDLPDSGETVAVSVDTSASAADRQDSGIVIEDEEHTEYSKKVQRRIDKLTKKTREAERQQDAAINYAKTIQAENATLKNRVQNLDQGYVAEYGDRVATQANSLAKDLETAIATNDTATQVELNKKLAQLAIEEERVKTAQLQQRASYATPQQAAYAAQSAQAAQAAQVAQQVPVRPDPKAEAWASKNPWFGEDEAMTFAAFGIHKALVEDEAFDTESKEYYDELDKRLVEAFPHKFGEIAPAPQSRRPQQAVASATRSSSSGRKTVRLSPSEVAIADKLGVPLNEYAKYKR
jgi:hypothetical protein|tara:strand:+ start:1526 stop:2425 length:900 start_codon:yes stop_codon:yes gene_type:complete